MSPSPEKVFCVGMNKTGTSTMKHCFEMLGLHPIASPSEITRELRQLVKNFYQNRDPAPLVEAAAEYRSFEDRPWNMWGIYRHLDKRYPDSKFILTLRDEDSWWRSVERWIKVQKPHMTKLYLAHLGVDEVTGEAMKAAYRQYNEEVIKYFEGTGKLLLMDLEKGDGWEKLCGFLDTRVPDHPFPHANRQAYTPEDREIIRQYRQSQWAVFCQSCDHEFRGGNQATSISTAKSEPKRIGYVKALSRQFRRSGLYRSLIRKPVRELRRLHLQIKNPRKKLLQQIKSQHPKLTADNLAVVTCLFNPTDSKRRLENFTRFLEGIKKAGVHCLVVELAFGTKPFMITDHEPVIQLRSHDIMWHKERLLNIGIERLLEEGYEKIAWLDGDILFDNPDWPLIISAELETNNLCQVFSRIHVESEPGIMGKEGLSSIHYFHRHQSFINQPPIGKKGKPTKKRLGGQSGFGWAARAELLKKCLLFEHAIVGGGDKMMMSASLADTSEIAKIEEVTHSHNACPKCGHRNRSEAYTEAYLQWARRWADAVDGKVGFAPLEIRDMYHGNRANRKYLSRRNILYKHLFDPEQDLGLDEEGCLKWASDKFGLRRDIKSYFTSRREDA